MNTSQETKSKLPDNFLVFAHRGAMGTEPENTLRAFKVALEMGAPAIELDVWCCKTGELVVTHGKDHTDASDETYNVEEMTLDEIKKLDAGEGEQIPTLKEVLDLVNHQALLAIELKGEGTATAVAQLIQEYVTKKDWAWNDFFVISFNHVELQKLQKLCPEVNTGATSIGIQVDLAAFGTRANAQSIQMNTDFITKDVVDDAHARSLKIYIFTVNTPKDVKWLLDLGVDGIFSNYPDMALQTLAEIEAEKTTV